MEQVGKFKRCRKSMGLSLPIRLYQSEVQRKQQD